MAIWDEEAEELIEVRACGIEVAGAGDKGVGVFALHRFMPGDRIEVAPVLFIEIDESPSIGRYVYDWDETHQAIGLGYASLYNHSLDPNAVYDQVEVDDGDDGVIEISALKEINPGDEILINYNGDPEDQTPWDFEEDDGEDEGAAS